MHFCQSGEEATIEKKGLENEIQRCIERLDRAEKLTSGLEEEKVRIRLFHSRRNLSIIYLCRPIWWRPH